MKIRQRLNLCVMGIFASLCQAHAAETGIDGAIVTVSSLTVSGPVYMSSLTATSATVSALSISTITVASSATIANASIANAAVTAATINSLSMNSNKISNLANATSAGDAVSFSQVSGYIVKQIIMGTSATTVTVSTTTWTDTTLSLSITPTSATSKILVLVSQNMFQNCNNSSNYGDLRLDRAGTIVQTINQAIRARTSAGGVTEVAAQVSMVYLDSPGSVSATTYKTQIRSATGSAATTAVNLVGGPSTMILAEVLSPL